MKRAGFLNAFVTVLLVGTAVLAAQVGVVKVADLDRLLVEVLQVRPGAVLADIGAGPDALLAARMARHVGPSGRVYATEIGERALGNLREAIRREDVKNVEVIEGHPARTNLPTECCDGIYIRNVYHHFADPPAMNRSLFDSLKAGGRLVIIDFYPQGREAISPADRDTGGQHGVTLETVTTELLQEGFELILSEKRPDMWFWLVVQRPAE